MPRDETAASRHGVAGAALMLAGIVVSGPLGLWLVAVTHPAARWAGASQFARDFHWVQTVPFFGGFALLAGSVVIVAALFCLADEARRPRATIALVSTAVFATLILFNYVCQTTFVPALVRHYDSSFDAVISTFSLHNPDALAWAIEMWGYAALGAATWLSAPVLDRSGVEHAAARLMRLNGAISVIGGLVTSWRLSWVMTRAGLASYGLWNAVMFALAVLLLVAFRRRAGAESQPSIPASRSFEDGRGL